MIKLTSKICKKIVTVKNNNKRALFVDYLSDNIINLLKIATNNKIPIILKNKRGKVKCKNAKKIFIKSL